MSVLRKLGKRSSCTCTYTLIVLPEFSLGWWAQNLLLLVILGVFHFFCEVWYPEISLHFVPYLLEFPFPTSSIHIKLSTLHTTHSYTPYVHNNVVFFLYTTSDFSCVYFSLTTFILFLCAHLYLTSNKMLASFLSSLQDPCLIIVVLINSDSCDLMKLIIDQFYW